ncbi:hypothetical protein BY996DRAFT_6593455 [Phakopsora pachyrhizi]|nr:hypothetical protein BY996DRAFT_6593455 [Phakopsora pachyrhizi]
MNTSVIKPSRLLLLGLTDLTRWHLDSSAEGQVIWTYNSSPVPDHDQEGRLGYWTVALTESRGVGREVHLVGINIELEKVVFQVS